MQGKKVSLFNKVFERIRHPKFKNKTKKELLFKSQTEFKNKVKLGHRTKYKLKFLEENIPMFEKIFMTSHKIKRP